MKRLKPLILFFANKNREKFSSAIQSNFRYFGYDKFQYAYYNSLHPKEFSIVDSAKGVVFLGPQTSEKFESVFQSKDDFLRFCKRAYQRKVSRVALLDYGFFLPEQKVSIDFCIETPFGNNSACYIAERLLDYFQDKED